MSLFKQISYISIDLNQYILSSALEESNLRDNNLRVILQKENIKSYSEDDFDVNKLTSFYLMLDVGEYDETKGYYTVIDDHHENINQVFCLYDPTDNTFHIYDKETIQHTLKENGTSEDGTSEDIARILTTLGNNLADTFICSLDEYNNLDFEHDDDKKRFILFELSERDNMLISTPASQELCNTIRGLKEVEHQHKWLTIRKKMFLSFFLGFLCFVFFDLNKHPNSFDNPHNATNPL